MSNKSAEKNYDAKMQKIENTKPKCVLSLDLFDQNELHHRLIILEYLVGTRIDVLLNILYLPKENIPRRYKTYFKSKFINVLHTVDKYMKQMADIGDLRELTYTTIYANLVKLQIQYDVYVQKLNHILKKYKEKQNVFYTWTNCITFCCVPF